MAMVRNWKESFRTQDWPFAPTIYLLVREIFEGDKFDPDQWMLDLVREDAVALGLFTKKVRRLRDPVYEPQSRLAHDLLANGDAVLACWERVAQRHPEFATALDEETHNAIYSRKMSSGE